MLVVVSWVSFWLDPHAVPARVALGVTTLLTMSTQTASINNSLPPVAYTKAIDVWQGVCVTFVFSALLEYALVNYALRGDRSYILRRAMARRRRRNGGYTGDDDDYDNGGDDMDYGMDYDDSDEDMELFSPQLPNEERPQHAGLNRFQSGDSITETSHGCTKGNKNVLFSHGDNDPSVNLRRRSEKGAMDKVKAISLLSTFGSITGRSKSRNKNKYRVKNNILVNPPSFNGVGQAFQGDSRNNTVGNHVTNVTANRLGSLGSVSNVDSNTDPIELEQVVNGGFLSANGAHLDVYKTNLQNIVPKTSFKKNSNPFRSKRGSAVPMEKAKRIDVTSRILFPMVFATFNLAYWLNYLLQAQSEFRALLLKNDTHVHSNKS